MTADEDRSSARWLLHSTRMRLGLLLLLLVVIVVGALWVAQPRTPEQQAAVASQLTAAVHVTATVRGSALPAAGFSTWTNLANRSNQGSRCHTRSHK